VRLWLIGLAAAALIGLLTASWIIGSLIAQPRASHPTKPPEAIDVTIGTRDGVSLAGWYWPSAQVKAPGVLLLHGNGASRAMHLRRARWLSAAGYAVLAIDFRGHGQSTARPRSFGWFEAHDARAAFDWLKARQRGAPVGIVGVSLGGAAALLGASGPLPADALVLESVYPDIRHAIHNRVATFLGPFAYVVEPLLSVQAWPRFGLSPAAIAPQAAAARYPGPALVIGGGADRYTPADETRRLYDALPGTKSLWIVPGLGHHDIGGLDSGAYRSRLLGFFESTLRRRGASGP
jgi:pimeloyl-ACP methyl ester carboxylesterase